MNKDPSKQADGSDREGLGIFDQRLKQPVLITEEVAKRRYAQGHFYLMGQFRNDASIPNEELIGVVALMAYLSAYAYPDDNLFLAKQRLAVALDFMKDKVDLPSILDRAIGIAEIFRRPWSESPPEGQTHRSI